MTKAIALTRTVLPAFAGGELLRAALVIGCAMSLILAGSPLPL